MALNKFEKRLLEEKLYRLIKEEIHFGSPIFGEGDEDVDDYDDDDDDDDAGYDEDIYEKHGVKVSYDGIEDLEENLWNKLKVILPAIEDSNDDGVHSFNLTRSQIAYELWPNIDKDSARSKLSQKINGSKSWKAWELNKLANIVSSDVA